MSDYDTILQIAKKNNGIFKTKMIVEAGIRKEKIKDLVESGKIERFHYTLQDFYEIGLVEGHSPQGFSIYLYDRERTICDLIRHRKQIQPAIYSQMINSYFKSREKNIQKLAKYSRIFHVGKELEMYMEVL